jgi:hypothetical protein
MGGVKVVKGGVVDGVMGGVKGGVVCDARDGMCDGGVQVCAKGGVYCVAAPSELAPCTPRPRGAPPLRSSQRAAALTLRA